MNNNKKKKDKGMPLVISINRKLFKHTSKTMSKKLSLYRVFGGGEGMKAFKYGQ